MKQKCESFEESGEKDGGEVEIVVTAVGMKRSELVIGCC